MFGNESHGLENFDLKGTTPVFIEQSEDSLPTLPQLPTLDEMAKGFSATLSSQERRLMRAFPNMRPTNWRRALEEHRSSLQEALHGVRR